jgi:hypothetical protein
LSRFLRNLMWVSKNAKFYADFESVEKVLKKCTNKLLAKRDRNMHFFTFTHVRQTCTAHRYVRVHAKRASMSGGMLQRARTAHRHVRVHVIARIHSLQACQDVWYREHALRTGVSGCMQRAHAQISSMSGGMVQRACTTHRHVRVHAKRACQEEWYSEHALCTGMSGCM